MKTISFLILFLAAGAFSQAAVDSRFGTVGPNNGNWQWYRMYNQDYSGFNSSTVPEPRRLYTVGKLDDPQRTLSGEDWCQGGHGFLECDRSTQSREKQREIYGRIFEHDMPGIRRMITEFNRRFGSAASANNYNGSQELHIAIGNEPNWHPYVHPDVYAAIFKRYYDFIKGPLPNGLNCAKCVVHNGGVILSNFDITTAPETWLEVGLVWLEAIAANVANVSNKRLDYMTWTRIFLEELITGLHGKYDIFNVHAYEIDLNWNGLAVTENGRTNMKKFIQLLKGGSYKWGTHRLASGDFHCFTYCGGGAYYGLGDLNGRCATFQSGFPMVFKTEAKCKEVAGVLNAGGHYANTFPWNVPNPVVWVDEFGLIKDGGSQTYALTVMENYVNFFKSEPNIHRWFWYKSVGKDDAIFGNDILRFWSKLNRGWESDQIALFNNSTSWQLTSLGSKYLSLQDQTYGNYHYPRLSFDAPNLATHLNLPRWSNDPKNIQRLWDFSVTADVQAWNITGYQQFADGIKMTTSPCPGHSILKTLSPVEIALAEGSQFFVVEKGLRPPPSGVSFYLTYRNKANPTSTMTKQINNFAQFSPVRNELADLGMADIVDIQAHKPAGYELSAIQYTAGISLNTCPQGGSYEHVYGRAYFCINNPVPIIGGAYPYYQYYSGVILEKTISSTKKSLVPINLNTQYCTSCTMSLDAGSLAKGIQIEGQYLAWKPTLAQVGLHSGTITVNINGINIPKRFNIAVTKTAPTVAGILGLLLD